MMRCHSSDETRTPRDLGHQPSISLELREMSMDLTVGDHSADLDELPENDF
jgi:hypothetical protein